MFHTLCVLNAEMVEPPLFQRDFLSKLLNEEDHTIINTTVSIVAGTVIYKKSRCDHHSLSKQMMNKNKIKCETANMI